MYVFLEISIHTELYQLGNCPNVKSSNPTPRIYEVEHKPLKISQLQEF